MTEEAVEGARWRLARLRNFIDEGGMLSAIDEVYEGDSMSLTCHHWEEKFAPDLQTLLSSEAGYKERVEELTERLHEPVRRQAKACLEALMVPTSEMVKAGEDAAPGLDTYANPRDTFTAMIQSALNAPPAIMTITHELSPDGEVREL